MYRRKFQPFRHANPSGNPAKGQFVSLQPLSRLSILKPFWLHIVLSLKSRDGMREGHRSCVQILEYYSGNSNWKQDASLPGKNFSCSLPDGQRFLHSFQERQDKVNPCPGAARYWEQVILQGKFTSSPASRGGSKSLPGCWVRGCGSWLLERKVVAGERCAPGNLEKVGLAPSHTSFPSSSHSSGSCLWPEGHPQ